MKKVVFKAANMTPILNCLKYFVVVCSHKIQSKSVKSAALLYENL